MYIYKQLFSMFYSSISGMALYKCSFTKYIHLQPILTATQLALLKGSLIHICNFFISSINLCDCSLKSMVLAFIVTVFNLLSSCKLETIYRLFFFKLKNTAMDVKNFHQKPIVIFRIINCKFLFFLKTFFYEYMHYFKARPINIQVHTLAHFSV